MIKILKLLSPKLRFLAFLVIFLTLFQPFISFLIPSIIKQVIELAANNQTEPVIKILFWNINAPSFNQALSILIALILSLAILLMIVTFTSALLSNKFAIFGAYELRKKLFVHILNLSQTNIDKYNEGTLIARFTNDIQKIKDGLQTMVRPLFLSPFLFIWGLVFSITTNIYLSISIFVIIPFIIFGSFFAIKKVFPLYRKENYTVDILNNIAKEDINAISLIKSYNLENKRFLNYDKSARSAYNTAKKANLISITFWPLIDIISSLGNSFIFIIIAVFIAHGSKVYTTELIGQIYQFSTYLLMVTNSIFWTMFSINRLFRSQTSAKRYIELISEKSEIDKQENGYKIKSGSIEFKNVTFSYPNRTNSVLDNVSFKIENGKTLGIIGKTGSGKSTLIKLLTKEYQLKPNQGQIYIDNKEINEINLDDYYKKISVVLQKTKLLSGTIAENLKFREKDISFEELKERISLANANFVYSFDKELDYEISQKGKNLSGGQQQRLSIAQAISKDLNIFVMDDSASALDNQTDYEIRNKLKDKFKNTTVVIIAQRISTIKEADKILVLDKGKVVGFDNHINLLKNNRIYQEIYQSQNEVVSYE